MTITSDQLTILRDDPHCSRLASRVTRFSPSQPNKGANMASFQIVAVRTESSASGLHEHISAVKTSGGGEWSRSTVVYDIRHGTDSYYTEVNGNRADVIVVDCPYCNFSDYIRTTADATTADNLLSLPKF
jgi:hypothetical protein